jgi:hypothetical protein
VKTGPIRERNGTIFRMRRYTSVCHIRTQVKSYGDLVRGLMTFSVARDYKDVEVLSLYHLFSSIINFLMVTFFLKIHMLFYLKLNTVV